MAQAKGYASQRSHLSNILKRVVSKYRRLAGPRILANSIPKAGTNLLLEFFNNIEGLKNVNRGVDFLMSLEEVYDTLGGLRRGEYLYGHLFYDQAISVFLEQCSISHVFIVRDPRSVAVSLALYVPGQPSNRFYKFFKNLNSDRERIIYAIQGVPENLMEGQPGLGSMAERYCRCAPWLQDERCQVVRFEDLVGTRGGGDDKRQLMTIRRIAKHVGIKLTENQLHRIANSMFNEISPTFRKGKIGSWRDWLDAEMLSMLSRDKAIYREFGYEL
jgi:hypothetical protein